MRKWTQGPSNSVRRRGGDSDVSMNESSATLDPEQAFEVEEARAREEMRAELGDRAVRSVAWRGLAMSASILVRLGVLAALGRLLAPSAFGIVAMSAVVLGFAGSIADLGLGSALVQRSRVTPAQLRWVARTNLITACGLGLACVLGSSAATRFFHEPLAGPVLALTAVTLPLSAIAFVPRALLTRRLEFAKLARCEVASAVVTGVVSAGLAAGGLGVWSLVAGTILGTAVGSALLLLLAPSRPPASGAAHDRAGLLRFGVVVAALGVLNYWAYSVSNLVVGHVLGAAALGLYAISYNLALTLPTQLAGLASVVAFPAFSAIQEDRTRLAAAYLGCVRWSAAAAFPCCALMAALAPQVIVVLLGHEWIAAVTPLRLLLLIAAVRSLYTFAGSVLRAVGRPQVELLFQGVFCVGVAGAAAFGARFGVTGVAAAVAGFVCCIAGPLFIWATARAAGTTLLTVFRTASVPTAAAVISGAVAFGMVGVLGNAWPPALLLVGAALSGAAVYLLAVAVLSPPLVTEARARLRGLKPARRADPLAVGSE